MKKILYLFLLLGVCLVIPTSCKKDRLEVKPDQLWGEWAMNDYHWTFNEDFSGKKIYTGGDYDPDDETNGDFTWNVDVDELEVIFTTYQITKLFTITDISSSSMTWEDVYGRTMKFTKQDKKQGLWQ